MSQPAIGGTVSAGFDKVFRAFHQNFRKRDEVGASVAVWVDGEQVVDLWGGVRDRHTRDPWSADTLQIIFSATKGLAATALLCLVDRDLLDLDKRVAHYWPEFAAHGKQQITVRQLLNHTSGLSAVELPLSLDDLEAWSNQLDPSRVQQALVVQEPLWSPGSAQGYGAVSFGLYAGELFRQVTGTDLGAFIRDEIAAPLKADIHLGLPDSEHHRMATLYPTGPRTLVRHILPRVFASAGVEGRLYRRFLNKTSPTSLAFSNPAALGVKGVKNFNTPRVHRMALPWASGTATARGLSKVYNGLLTGALVRPNTLHGVTQRQSWGWDKVLCKPMGFSQGFVKDELHLYSPSPQAFGHPGAGGALGFADPSKRIAFGYVMNRMDFRLRSPRALALAKAVYACV